MENLIYETVDELLNFIYSKEESADERKHAYVVMVHVELAFVNEFASNTSNLNFLFINELLGKLDVTRTTTRCLIAVIRSTSRNKEYFSNWLALLEKINAEMVRRNLDNKALLRGLS